MHSSPLFSLNLKDLLKGLIIAMLSAVIATLQTTFQAGSFAVNWHSVGAVATAAGLSYLLKNFFTPSEADGKQSVSTHSNLNTHDNI